MKRLIATIVLVAGILTVLPLGAVTAAHAAPAAHASAFSRAQAVRKAKDYLEYDAFSFSGLVHQLEFEGFTHAQAVHGAHGAGL